MKALLRQPDSWIEQAPRQCTATLEIGAAPADIWAVLADHESWLDEEFVAWDVGERFAFVVVEPTDSRGN